MKTLLTNRDWNVPGNWYEPCQKLKQFKSVISAEYNFTSSSAGDWSGLFIQKLNGKLYSIAFEQENNSPYSGFTLRTNDEANLIDEQLAKIILKYPMLRFGHSSGCDCECESIWSQAIELTIFVNEGGSLGMFNDEQMHKYEWDDLSIEDVIKILETDILE